MDCNPLSITEIYCWFNKKSSETITPILRNVDSSKANVRCMKTKISKQPQFGFLNLLFESDNSGCD